MDLLNSYVSFKVSDDHIGCGQVVGEVNDEIVSVKVPSGQIIEIGKAEIEQIDNEKYLEIVNDLIRRIHENTGVNKMTEQEIKDLQTKLTEAESKVNELNTLLEASKNDKSTVENTVAELTKQLEDSKTKLTELETKLAEIEAARVGEARFNELGAEAALLALKVEKEDDAKATLATMSDSTYDIIKTVIAALPKSTKETHTSLPKSTEQTHTSLEAGTEVSNASVDEDESLTNASETEVDRESELAQAMCAVFDKKRNKK